jgi:hypothetical protein
LPNIDIPIWFTTREIFDMESNAAAWEGYITWSKLKHLEELVTLDGILNGPTFQPNFENEADEIIIIDNKVTPLYKSIDYVKRKNSHLDYFNLLAVIKEPKKLKQIQLERDFDFIGYDLIETEGEISALANCEGFEDTVDPKEQNKYGLISDYEKAIAIQIALSKNHPHEHHAECDLYEIWRHKFLGRNGSFNKDFCQFLEYHLGETFAKSASGNIQNFWCDGVMHKRIRKKQVNDLRVIYTKAWIGLDGQVEYKMNIRLGNKALRRFAKGTSMIDCIPSSDSMDWIKINTINNEIEINLV